MSKQAQVSILHLMFPVGRIPFNKIKTSTVTHDWKPLCVVVIVRRHACATRAESQPKIVSHHTKVHLNRILTPVVARAVTSMVLATTQQSTELSTMARHIRRHLGWVYAPLWFRLLKEQCCTLTIYVRGGLSEHNPLLPTPAPAVSTFPPYLPTRMYMRIHHGTAKPFYLDCAHHSPLF
jgi:hypothetical protein